MPAGGPTSVFKRAARLEEVRGFTIDRVARSADASTTAGARWPILRMENLDTNLPLPPEAVPATVEALTTPAANSWLPFTGDLGLRAAVSDFLHERTGHRYDPEREIVITNGGTEALLDTLLATVDPGDRVLCTDPTYAGIVNRIRLAGGVPDLVPYRPEGGEWRLDLDAFRGVAARRPAAAVLMSPSMPSGAVLTRAEWEGVRDACVEHGVPLIYDAAMERLLFDGRPLVHPLHLDGMADRTVVAGSLSKEHRMIGWRVGWAAGPAETIADVGWAHVYNTTTPTGVARAAATAVLRGPQEHVAEATAELERRRDAVLDALRGWPVTRPAGGWSLLVDAAAMGLEPRVLSEELLAEAGIAATPMTGWGGPVAGRHVRLVYSAEPLDALATLPDRLEPLRSRGGARPRPA